MQHIKFIKRNAVFDLTKWLVSFDRKPLILRGARQVGKSTLVRQVALENNIRLVEVNLEEYFELETTFKSLKIDKIISELEAISKNRINETCILFLDEVQACPSALAVLRYFYEKYPHIPVIAAGSLLEFVLEEHIFSMPVGRVDYYYLHPLTFREFANSKCSLFDLEIIDKYAMKKIDSIPEAVHQRMNQILSEYVIIGGMPGILKKYLSNNDNELIFKDIHEAQIKLVNSYKDDFAKYRKKVKPEHLLAILNSITNVIGDVKVKYTNLLPTERQELAKTALEHLVLSGIINKITAVTCNTIPLIATEKANFFKIIPLDVGLFLGALFSDRQSFKTLETLFNRWEHSIAYEQSWLGQITECFIGQSLLAKKKLDKTLHYWIRETKNSNAEIDYVIEFKRTIIPIEVKTGTSGKLKSLHSLMAEKSLNFALRFDANPPTVQNILSDIHITKGEIKTAKYKLLNLPLYMIDWLDEILDNYLN